MNLFINLFSLMGPLRPPEYLGPETLMPLASILAAIAGFFLLFWRIIVKFVKTLYRKVRGLPDEVPPEVEDPAEEEQEK
ncbi:MAG: hypothetical protein AB1509_05925 [Chloroflexota bacterium]